LETADHDEVNGGGTLSNVRKTVAAKALRAVWLAWSWLKRSARSGRCFGEDGEDYGGEATVKFASGMKLSDGGGKLKRTTTTIRP
jgi:hypothetical protein